MATLTEMRVLAAKPAEKPYKLFDERGLFMLVTPAGGRLWRFRYWLGGVEKLLTLGTYPDVSLKRAREKRDDARRALADGIDPGAKRRAESDAKTNTFSAVADEWLLTKKASLTESTWERDRQQVHKWVIPYLGNKPIASLEAPDLLEVLKRIESKRVSSIRPIAPGKSVDAFSATRSRPAARSTISPRTSSERLRPARQRIMPRSLILRRWERC